MSNKNTILAIGVAAILLVCALSGAIAIVSNDNSKPNQQSDVRSSTSSDANGSFSSSMIDAIRSKTQLLPEAVVTEKAAPAEELIPVIITPAEESSSVEDAFIVIKPTEAYLVITSNANESVEACALLLATYEEMEIKAVDSVGSSLNKMGEASSSMLKIFADDGILSIESCIGDSNAALGSIKGSAATLDGLAAVMMMKAQSVGDDAKGFQVASEELANMAAALSESEAAATEAIKSIDGLFKQYVEFSSEFVEIMNAMSGECSEISECMAAGKYVEAMKIIATMADNDAKSQEVLQGMVVCLGQLFSEIDALSANASKINEVVSQLNLAVMNLSIEAAHGGESAKAFSTYANQVRGEYESVSKNATAFGSAFNGASAPIKSVLSPLQANTNVITGAFAGVAAAGIELDQLILIGEKLTVMQALSEKMIAIYGDATLVYDEFDSYTNAMEVEASTIIINEFLADSMEHMGDFEDVQNGDLKADDNGTVLDAVWIGGTDVDEINYVK